MSLSLWAILIAAAVIVILTAWVRLQPGIFGGGLAHLPFTGPAALERADTAFVKADAVATDPVLRLAQRALDENPLASSPLVTAALAADRGGDPRRAAALVELALKRDPRNRAARFWLYNRAVRQGDMPQAVSQLDRLMLLERFQSDPILDMMVALTRDPRSHSAIQSAIARNPRWASAFLIRLNRAGGDNGLLFRLTRRDTSRAPQQVRADREQRTYLTRLIEQGEVERAYAAWVNFLPESALSSVGLIYDSNFEGLPGPPPFNWLLTSGSNGSAEIDADRRMLNISYGGDRRALLGQQILLLGAGRYALNAEVTGRTDTGGNDIRLEIACLNAPRPLAGESLSAVGDGGAVVTLAFTVPANCLAQSLSFRGVPGEFAAPAEAHIRAITIARGNDVG